MKDDTLRTNDWLPKLDVKFKKDKRRQIFMKSQLFKTLLGDWLIFAVPELVKENRTFQMLYRCEPTFGKCRAILNKIERRANIFRITDTCAPLLSYFPCNYNKYM